MEEDECNIGLGLAVGGGRHFASNQSRDGERKPPVQFHILFPLRRREEEEEEEGEEEEEKPAREEQHKSKSINEEDDTMSATDIGDGGNNQVGMRKKLRLTQEQLTLLENSFREHNTLNQKQQLAGQLNLRPRQVEVWFQNRRARTKLKQTEVDCEFLKKYCENLRNENRRLKRELEDLKAMETGWPFHIRVPKAATLTMCPSCNRIMASGGEKGNGALETMKGRPSGSCK